MEKEWGEMGSAILSCIRTGKLVCQHCIQGWLWLNLRQEKKFPLLWGQTAPMGLLEFGSPYEVGTDPKRTKQLGATMHCPGMALDLSSMPWANPTLPTCLPMGQPDPSFLNLTRPLHWLSLAGTYLHVLSHTKTGCSLYGLWAPVPAQPHTGKCKHALQHICDLAHQDALLVLMLHEENVSSKQKSLGNTCNTQKGQCFDQICSKSCIF